MGSWLRKRWCIHAVSPALVAAAEDMADRDTEPYHPTRPVGRFDEPAAASGRRLQ